MKKKINSFTLVELLVAVSILTVVMVAVYSAFHSGIFGYRNIEETIDSYQSALSVLERLDKDLRNCFAYSGEDTKFTGSSNEVSFFTLVDVFKEDKLESRFAYVSYGTSDNKLSRLCRVDDQAFNDNSAILPEEMAEDIQIKLQYGYLSPDGKLDYKDNWDEKNALPLSVKASLTTTRDQPQVFERTIYLMVRNEEKK